MYVCIFVLQGAVYQPQATTIVTTSSGYTSVANPPVYIAQPPNQQYPGFANPQYGEGVAMESYKAPAQY